MFNLNRSYLWTTTPVCLSDQDTFQTCLCPEVCGFMTKESIANVSIYTTVSVLTGKSESQSSIHLPSGFHTDLDDPLACLDTSLVIVSSTVTSFAGGVVNTTIERNNAVNNTTKPFTIGNNYAISSTEIGKTMNLSQQNVSRHLY